MFIFNITKTSSKMFYTFIGIIKHHAIIKANICHYLREKKSLRLIIAKYGNGNNIDNHFFTTFTFFKRKITLKI